MMPAPELHAAKDRYKDNWLDIDGVEAVTVKDTHICVCLSDDSAADNIPDTVTVRGHQIDVETDLTGKFGAIPTRSADGEQEYDAMRTQRYRPVPAGVSIGHKDITSGTASFTLEDPDTGARYLSSNAHVLANDNQGDPGDSIHQPGPNYNGDHCGHLKDSIPIEDGATVDLAWAELSEDPDPSIIDIDDVDDPVEVRVPNIGDTVTKSGITTGVTSGRVRQLDAAVNVNFGDPTGTVRMEHCIITDPIVEPGDSGSPVIDENGNPAGMVFAGSDNHSVMVAPDQIEQESGLTITRTDPQDDSDPDPDPARHTVTIELTPMQDTDPETGRLTIKTHDETDGESISGVSLTIDDGEETDTTTDKTGEAYATVDLTTGEISVDAEADDYEPTSVTIDPDDFEQADD